jgi:hypothetical protein
VVMVAVQLTVSAAARATSARLVPRKRRIRTTLEEPILMAILSDESLGETIDSP